MIFFSWSRSFFLSSFLVNIVFFFLFLVESVFSFFFLEFYFFLDRSVFSFLFFLISIFYEFPPLYVDLVIFSFDLDPLPCRVFLNPTLQVFLTLLCPRYPLQTTNIIFLWFDFHFNKYLIFLTESILSIISRLFQNERHDLNL